MRPVTHWFIYLANHNSEKLDKLDKLDKKAKQITYRASKSIRTIVLFND
jgi:hypothetical protein